MGASVTAKLTGDDVVGKTYTIAYTIKGSVELLDKEGSTPTEFKFPIKWRLYESDNQLTPSTIVTCTKVEPETIGNEVQYKQECQESEQIGDVIAKGIINPTDGETIGQEQADGATLTTGNKAEISVDKTIDATSVDAKNIII